MARTIIITVAVSEGRFSWQRRGEQELVIPENADPAAIANVVKSIIPSVIADAEAQEVKEAAEAAAEAAEAAAKAAATQPEV